MTNIWCNQYDCKWNDDGLCKCKDIEISLEGAFIGCNQEVPKITKSTNK